MSQYIQIKLQDGPIKEVGVNGAQIDEVIEFCINTVTKFNQPPYACRENALAITKLEEAMMWLRERTRKREARGVEGTSAT